MTATPSTPAARASEYDVPSRTAPGPTTVSSAGAGPLQDAIRQLSEIVSMLQQTIQLLQDALRASQ